MIMTIKKGAGCSFFGLGYEIMEMALRSHRRFQ